MYKIQSFVIVIIAQKLYKLLVVCILALVLLLGLIVAVTIGSKQSNDDEVAKEYRPYKQMIERLNRTYKASYRPTNGFDNYDGANYDLALWVAYYNFLRPHKHNNYKVLNKVEMLENADNMPAKWQLLIFLGQQTILNLQAEDSNCS